MADSLKGFFAGALARDAESRFSTSGTEMVSFSVPTEEYAAQGQEPVTQWIRVTLFGDRGSKIKQWLVKGQMVSVSGEQKVGLYTANDGKSRITIDFNNPTIKFIGPRVNKDSSQEEHTPAARNGASYRGRGQSIQEAEEDEGDMPF